MTNQNTVRAKVIRNGEVIREDYGPNSLTLYASYENGGFTGSNGMRPFPFLTNIGYLIRGVSVDYKNTSNPGSANRITANVLSSEYSVNPNGGLERVTNYVIPINEDGLYTALTVGATTPDRMHAYFTFEPSLDLISGDTVEVEYTSRVPWGYIPNQNGYTHVILPLFSGDVEVVYKDIDGNIVDTDMLPCVVNSQLLTKTTTGSTNHVTPLVCGSTMDARTNSTYLWISQTQQDPMREGLPANQALAGRTLVGGLNTTDVQSLSPEIGAHQYGFVGRTVEYTLDISAGGDPANIYMIAPALGTQPLTSGGAVRIFFPDRPIALDPEYSCSFKINLKTEWDPPQGFLDEFPNWVRPND